MDRRVSKALAAFGCTALIASSAPAFAGSGNTIYLKQDSTLGGAGGNTIYVDQSAATNSQVGGIEGVTTDDGTISYGLAANPLEAPALQKGGNNSARVAISGDAANLFLLQNNVTSGSAYIGNTAELSLRGNNTFAAVDQSGDGNKAWLTVKDDGSRGRVSQTGDNLSGELTVTNGSHGTLLQTGTNASTSLSVTAPAGANVTYAVNGNDVTTPGGVQVVTNGANITITQTSTFH